MSGSYKVHLIGSFSACQALFCLSRAESITSDLAGEIQTDDPTSILRGYLFFSWNVNFNLSPLNSSR